MCVCVSFDQEGKCILNQGKVTYFSIVNPIVSSLGIK